jgi:hypothetical protein
MAVIVQLYDSADLIRGKLIFYELAIRLVGPQCRLLGDGKEKNKFPDWRWIIIKQIFIFCLD